MESSYFEKSIQPLVETTNISLQPEQDIYQAMEFLNTKKRPHGAIVLDKQQKMVGILTEKDCLRHYFDAKYNSMPPGKVKDYMSKKVVAIPLETDIYKVVELFIKNDFHSYPVTKDGLYYGFIKRTKVFQAIQKMEEVR